MNSLPVDPLERMNQAELRASVSLASVQALRMLGLFLVLPVLAVHARAMPEGGDAHLVGIALGIYGLTQAMLQLPFGAASDRFGRKPVIVAGLALFALGSFIAAAADDLWMVILGRGLQGAGAISAAVSAFVADSTRDSQRTKAMAMVGITIGASFALSLIIAPPLYRWIGIGGMFGFTGALALAAIAWVIFVVPAAPRTARGTLSRQSFLLVARDRDLMRLNFGIFTLHAVQVAIFVVLPGWLVERAGLELASHWLLYLPVVLLSFWPMMPAVRWGERRQRQRFVFIACVAALGLVMAALAARPEGLVPFAVLLFVFFAAFNILEASLPSMVSRLAPHDIRGTALGLFNTTQSLGLFAGGAVAGVVRAGWGDAAVFVIATVIIAVWLFAALGHRQWPVAAH
jgi:MFS family permease